MSSLKKFLILISTLWFGLALSACTDPATFVAGGVKSWCKQDVHCGRSQSDPSQGPERTLPNRDDPIGRPQ